MAEIRATNALNSPKQLHTENTTEKVKTPAVRRQRLTAVLASLLLIIVISVPWMIVNFGQWLVVEDPLEPSRAVVVLSGALPFRAMEAARIYRLGFAPEVWVTRTTLSVGAEDALKRLGVRHMGEDMYSVQVLKQMGVPEGSIRVLGDRGENTQGEVLLIAKELRRSGAGQVIIVTSKYSARRTQAISRALLGGTPRAIIRYNPEDPFDARHWWRTTRDIQAVTHEMLGLFNVWVAFRVPRDDQK